MVSLPRTAFESVIRRALREDAASRDVTSRAVLPPSRRVRARVTAKAAGVLAGGPLACRTFTLVDPTLRCRPIRPDGTRLKPGQTLLIVEGSARSIFAAERTALNLLGHLSGVATLTRAFIQRAGRTRAKILDTRKTLPGLRALEKYAVRTGGGHSHRGDLAEAVLIKTNHLRTLTPRGSSFVHRGSVIQKAIAAARHRAPGRFVEIEVTGLQEFRTALLARPDAILLDNWRLPDIRKAVALRDESRSTIHDSLLLEVSGGVTLANVRAIARTGVDRISIGRLTHSAPSLDVSLAVLS